MQTNIYEVTQEVLNAISEFRVDLKYLRKGVEKLERVVVDGNGQPSLISRVITLESGLAEQELDNSNKKAMAVAVIGSLVAWGAVVVEYLLG